VRKTTLALAAAGALMTIMAFPNTPAHAVPSAPLGDHASAVAEKKQQRRARAARKRERGFAAVAIPAHLQAIAACESGGDPRAIGGGGRYRGKYQFDYGTWASVGGSGDPAAASEAEQDVRAALLYQRAGASPWPVCG
jgi:soluble lytic murein transglycosylase-like protein